MKCIQRIGATNFSNIDRNYVFASIFVQSFIRRPHPAHTSSTLRFLAMRAHQTGAHPCLVLPQQELRLPAGHGALHADAHRVQLAGHRVPQAPQHQRIAAAGADLGVIEGVQRVQIVLPVVRSFFVYALWRRDDGTDWETDLVFNNLPRYLLYLRAT